MRNGSIVAGVDIGGSHITGALVSLNMGSVIAETCIRKLINPNGTLSDIIGEWSSVIKNVFNGFDYLKKIGIAMPGPFDYKNGISLIKDQNKYDALYGHNIKTMLAQSLQINETDILFRNDAACFLQGEAFAGAAKNFRKAIGLTLGTGLGSAILENGVAKDADLWHSPFLDGIAEDYLSTRWFVKYFYEITGRRVSNVIEIIQSEDSDDSVNNVFDVFGKNLSLFLSEYILDEKPEVIVLGGNIANAYPLFYKSLFNNLPKSNGKIYLKKASLGENGNLVGAASCWYKPLKTGL